MKDVVVHSSRTHVIARSWGVSAWKAGRESELLPPARLFWCCFQSKQAATNTATLDQRPRRRPFARSKSILDHVLLGVIVLIISAPRQLFLETPLLLTRLTQASTPLHTITTPQNGSCTIKGGRHRLFAMDTEGERAGRRVCGAGG